MLRAVGAIEAGSLQGGQEIDRAPSGPKIAAFFDVDRTLLAGFSAVGFLKDRFASGGFSLGDVAQAAAGTLRFGAKQTSFPSFLEETSTNLVGLTEAELREQGERVFAKHLVTDIYPSRERPIEGVTADLVIEAARRSGHRQVSHAPDRETAVDLLAAHVAPGDLVITLGAGDVYRLAEDLGREQAVKEGSDS